MSNKTGYGRNFGMKSSNFGSDGKGHNVKAYGNTSGKYVEWDKEKCKLNVAGSVELLSDAERMVKIVKVELKSGETGGGILSWVNPEDTDIIITRVIVDVTTKTSAACTIDIGTTATSATTSSDDLLDGIDVGTSVGLFDNIFNKGSNGKSKEKLAPGKWITASKASGVAAGLKGYAYIYYIVI